MCHPRVARGAIARLDARDVGRRTFPLRIRPATDAPARRRRARTGTNPMGGELHLCHIKSSIVHECRRFARGWEMGRSTASHDKQPQRAGGTESVHHDADRDGRNTAEQGRTDSVRKTNQGPMTHKSNSSWFSAKNHDGLRTSDGEKPVRPSFSRQRRGNVARELARSALAGPLARDR